MNKSQKLLNKCLDHINLESKDGIKFWDEVYDHLAKIGKCKYENK